jgi:hypothetical protein
MSSKVLLSAVLAVALVTPASAAVLVELFTSQGCPNCPRAQTLIERLDGELREDVVFLAFHVGIFDSPRFKDRFSRPEWTRRQEMYARPRFDTTLSTPEAIVNGTWVLVGDDEAGLRAAVARAKEQAPLRLVAIARDAGGEVDKGVSTRAYTVRIDGPVESMPRALDVWAAIYERHTSTTLPGAAGRPGRVLNDDFVVQRLEALGKLEPGSTTRHFHGTFSESAAGQELGVVVFVQDRKSLAIAGAVRVR